MYYTYTYDKAGNLTQTSYRLQGSSSGGGIEFNGIDGDASVLGLKPDLPPLNPTTYNTYTYTDSQWGDQLTSYNGTAITYDEIGNPLSYYNGSSYTFTWNGRRLATATKGTKSMSFAYNSDGLRISKTVNGVTRNYVYDGDLLVSEYTDSDTIVYIYDAYGSPIGFKYRTSSYTADAWDVYWYGKNLQGDIVAVYNSAGTLLMSYKYTAWGETTRYYSNSGANTTAVNNNLTYRGYYYDSDLRMYYLQSRYYDPVIGRFINADGYISTGQGLTGYNMFAYCGNNPVMNVDYSGDRYTMVAFDEDTGGLGVTNTVGGCVGTTARNHPIKVYNTDNFTIVIVNGSIVSYDYYVDNYPNRYSGCILVYDDRHTSKDNPNIQIYNSYQITKLEHKIEILKVLQEYDRNNPSSISWDRSLNSLRIEWSMHNILYFLYPTDRLAHTDFDKNNEGWSRIDYLKFAIMEFFK